MGWVEDGEGFSWEIRLFGFGAQLVGEREKLVMEVKGKRLRRV